jgi:GntR family transcriptional regulator
VTDEPLEWSDMSKLRTTYARSRVPLYIQVASALRRRIEKGEWQVGQQISTLEELEREFEVARVTVRQAVELLQNEGLVHRQQGRGTFVAEKLQDKHWLRLETTWESLIASIRDNVPIMMKVDDPPRWPRLDEGEGRRANEYVFLRSVQLKDGAPYALVDLHLDRQIYARHPELFRSRTALPILATLQGVDIKDAHQTLVIGSADPATASLLKVPLGAPTAECHCVVTNRAGVAIYVAEIIYRNDCVKLHIDLLGNSRRNRAAAGTPKPAHGEGQKTNHRHNRVVHKGRPH